MQKIGDTTRIHSESSTLITDSQKANPFSVEKQDSLIESTQNNCKGKVGRIISKIDKIIASDIGGYTLPSLVFVASLAFTGLAYRFGEIETLKNLQNIQDNTLKEFIHPIEGKINQYEEMIRGIRGLLSVKDITRTDFHSYVQSYSQTSDIKGWAISYKLHKDEIAGFNAELKKEGLPEFKNITNDNDYALVKYIEPLNEQFIGYNNFQSGVRKEALITAMLLDRMHLSNPVKLTLTDPDNPLAINYPFDAFLISYPFFKNGSTHETFKEREKIGRGWVTLIFSLKELVINTFSDHFEGMDISIYHGAIEDESKLIYKSPIIDKEASGPLMKSVQIVNIIGKDWTFVLRTYDALKKSYQQQYLNNILFTGGFITLLITSFSWFLINKRRESLHALEEMKKIHNDLKESETLHRVLFQKSLIPMLVIGTDNGKILFANDKAVEFYGYSIDELRGMSISNINTLTPEEIKEKMNLVREKGSEIYEFQHQIKGGEVRIVEVSSAHLNLYDQDILFSIIIDITKRKEATAKVLEMATHDPLTGLPNRRGLNEQLDIAISQAERSKEKLGLMFLDLDLFKHVNDTLGHDVGDKLLCQVAQRIKEMIRGHDTVCRQGGDEFIVLLTDIINVENAQLVSQKIIDAISKPFYINGNAINIGVSIGIALYDLHAKNSDLLLRYCDLAMYKAKREGRNQSIVFDPSMANETNETMKISNALHEAIIHQEFSTVYQPIVDLQTGSIRGIEALLRWESPILGNVTPGKFIPVAEETGLINNISLWNIHNVCATIATLNGRGIMVPRVAINISVKQFKSKTLLKEIRETLKQTGVNKNQIGFEITESILIENQDEALNILSELTSMGFTISIDDFGTGYTGLHLLRDFNVDKLKIDQSYIQKIHDEKNRMIVEGIIHMAHELGVTVIAEGVETKEQLEILKKLGCDCIQGFYFSRPQNEKDITDTLLEGKIFDV